MKIIGREILQSLYRPSPESHKGDNGRVLVIAGSDKYHGALLLAVQAASRLVDMVYVHSVARNLALLDRLKHDTSVFISILEEELWQIVGLVDAILVGPGLDESDGTIAMTKRLLIEYPEKKVVVDATALWHADPVWLRKNVIVTPHAREFAQVFKIEPAAANVQKMAAEHHCVVALKGQYDYVSDGKELWENRTGNVGMTKGGTGDVLAGLVGGLAAKNDPLTAALAGAYLNGLAGDRLYEKKGTFYNAEDLTEELGRVWKEMI